MAEQDRWNTRLRDSQAGLNNAHRELFRVKWRGNLFISDASVELLDRYTEALQGAMRAAQTNNTAYTAGVIAAAEKAIAAVVGEAKDELRVERKNWFTAPPLARSAVRDAAPLPPPGLPVRRATNTAGPDESRNTP